jgi:hypothetical protein
MSTKKAEKAGKGTKAAQAKTSLGERLIDAVLSNFKCEETLRRIPQGLEWGIPGARQRLWWENPQAGTDGGPDLVRMRILTEVVGLPPEPLDWSEQVLGTMLMASGASLWGGLMIAEELGGSLAFGAAISAHAGTEEVLPWLLFSAMAGQAAVRELLFGCEAGPELATFPGGETAGAMEDLAQSILLMTEKPVSGVPKGVSADLALLADSFRGFPCLWCTEEPGGLSALFPCGERPSMLRVDVASEHPIFGPAISLWLLLPVTGEAAPEMMKAVLEENREEQASHAIPWALGSWSFDQQLEEPSLAYRIWVPYAMFKRNLLVNLGMGMLPRANRCCMRMSGMDFEQAYPRAKADIDAYLRDASRTMGADPDGD